MSGVLIKDRIGNRNKFYCQGRALSGPDRLAFFLAICMTLIPVTAYLLFEGPWMWSWISPAVPIIEGWLFLCCTVFHFVCAFSDPGILPRVLEEEAADDNPWKQSRAFSSGNRSVKIKETVIKTKFCRTCQIQRPPRSIHCATCDNCVDRFDHHCPWTGNCVGRRNYKYFLMYVLFVPLLALFTIGTLMAKIIILSLNSPLSGPPAFWDAVTVDPAAPIILLYALIPLGFVGFLLSYHVILTMQDLTTNEKLKHLYKDYNPYSRGVLRNMFGRWCGSFPTRYIKMHVTEMEDTSIPVSAEAMGNDYGLDAQFDNVKVEL